MRPARVHRVFFEELQDDGISEAVISGQEGHHLSQVLRVKVGQQVKVFDGKGFEADGNVLSVERGRVGLELTSSPQPSPNESQLHIHLAVALLKGDKMSDIIRQCTELGVYSFIPFHSKFCDVRDLKSNKLERWRRVAQEAVKQSGRSLIPDVKESLSLSELELSFDDYDFVLCTDPYSPENLTTVMKDVSKDRSLNILCISGPEGGLSDEEVKTLVSKGAKAIQFGPRILRAETAPIALSAALLLPEAL